ncbi:MAG: 50S ribosomal protein L10 [Anaerolineae bacterium]
MALSREEKLQRVAQYVQQLDESQGIILVDYRGLSVVELEEIRKQMRPISSQFQIVKNRLLVRALEERGMSLPEKWLVGPTAVSFCREEIPPVAKALMEAGEETEKLVLKGGWMNQAVLSADQLKRIAELPPREVLLAQVLGAIHGPGRQVAGVVASGIRQVLNVVKAHVDKLEEGGPGADLKAAADPA